MGVWGPGNFDGDSPRDFLADMVSRWEKVIDTVLSGEVPDEAARLAADMNARLTIPCHYDMFAFNTADPEEFRSAADKCGIASCVLECGA